MLSPEEITALAKRVRPEDLRYVTPNDIERVAQSMTPQQLDAAMRVMVRENKFTVVAKETKQDTFEAAIKRVDRSSFMIASRLLISEPHTQHSILGKVPDSWKDACEALVRQKLGKN